MNSIKLLCVLSLLAGCANLPAPQTGIETYTDGLGRFHNHWYGMPKCDDVTLTKDPEKLLSAFTSDKKYSNICVVEALSNAKL